MLTPQQITTRLLEGTLNGKQAQEHLAKVDYNDRDQMIHGIVDRCDLLRATDPEPGSATTHYERGLDVLAELLTPKKMLGLMHLVNSLHDRISRLITSQNPLLRRLVNDMHDKVSGSINSPNPGARNEVHESKLGLIKLYVGLQAKSPAAALNFLTRGTVVARTDQIFKELAPYIDRPLIIDAAIEMNRIDMLSKKGGWDECLPHLTGAGRDAYMGRDLGL